MTEQRVSSRYSLALLNTAKEENLISQVYDDLKLIAEYIEVSRELRNLLNSPVVSHISKKNAFKEIFDAKINPLSMNFLLLLADKGRESLIVDIIKQYEIQYNELNGLIKVEITSALELSESMRTKIETKLFDITQKKILSKFIVDKTIKGGVQVRIDDWVYDASLANQLNSLHKSLAEGTI